MRQLLAVTSLLHLTAISLCAPSSDAIKKNSSTTYDQRQVGKYNIHFNIKDVSIIALSSDDIIDHIAVREKDKTNVTRCNFCFAYSDSYADYYDYEDSDYTVNPITADLSGRPTTKKPNVTQPLMPSIAGLNFSSLTSSTDLPASIPQSVVVIHERPTASHENLTKTDEKIESSSVSYQPDEIPVQVIVEPLLKPKTRPQQSLKRKLNNHQVNGFTDDDDDAVRPRTRRAQIRERIRSRRAQNKLARNGNIPRCGRGETGDCRVRRSSISGFLDFLTKFLPQRDSE